MISVGVSQSVRTGWLPLKNIANEPVGGGGWGYGRVGAKDGHRGHANGLESES